MKQKRIDLSHIRRPKLIMAAAKELVIRRQRIGKVEQSTPQAKIQDVVNRETELETLRKDKSVNYSVDMHIRCLADMIEYSRDTQIQLELA